MELLFFYLMLIFITILLLQILLYKQRALSILNLPLGRTGWPILGETLEFLSAGRRGHPEEFVLDRMAKYSPECFKTNILGQRMVFFCGPLGNKFLFFSEKNLVRPWWPDSFKKIFPNGLETDASYEVVRKVKGLLPLFLKPEALERNVGIIDDTTQRHFAYEWDGKDEIFVFPVVKKYTFWLACRLFLSIQDLNHVARLVDPFHLLASGLISIPIDFPGTPFSKAIKAAKFLKKEFTTIIAQKKHDLAMQNATPTQDLLSHMLGVVDENGENLITESHVAEAIVGLLVAGHEAITSSITFVVKYLAEHPHIYDVVYREQMEIAKSKEAGEFLSWGDIQKMKYSWNVACEVMRLVPPSPPVFREAMDDLTFSGFSIPKGWKLYWSAFSTHRNPQYFPNPDKFDPTRFEGNGPAPFSYVPFGGGPGMCPGREFARFEILVFMHNLVKRFRWEKLIPDEQVTIHLSPTPAKGLPIRLIPHEVPNKQD